MPNGSWKQQENHKREKKITGIPAFAEKIVEVRNGDKTEKKEVAHLAFINTLFVDHKETCLRGRSCLWKNNSLSDCWLFSLVYHCWPRLLDTVPILDQRTWWWINSCRGQKICPMKLERNTRNKLSRPSGRLTLIIRMITYLWSCTLLPHGCFCHGTGRR